MKKLKSHEIRQSFLDYFKQKGHEIVPSSPLVPADDPSLLFTNAGMVQFKKVFLGEEKRPYKRAASCQKCVRAGGKHNDLENVGYTARHHTFFEMLGNFSFGDYFKKEAIEFAWEFLVDRLGLPKDKLWVTVFREDDEAAELWPKLTGISPDRVVRLDEEDNFWAMGDTGPCGPCSEILIDQGKDVGCKRPECKVGCDCDRFLEIWNLVFMQYFKDDTGDITPLPSPCIDTGMGLERITAVCQGKLNNFDTDIFENIMALLGSLSGKEYGSSETTDVAMRVIADHSRAAAFLIADGVIPSNEGRGYVLRRIIRRAIRYGRVLGLRDPFMKKVAFQVIEDMGHIYPELSKNKQLIGQILDHEEERFAQTLGLGLRMLDEQIEALSNIGSTTISGDFIFKLYDTYGLPVDIVQDISKERGLDFDKEGFERMLERQRERSKKSAKETVTEKLPEAYRKLIESGNLSQFEGYEATSSNARIVALVSKGKEHKEVSKGWQGELVSNKTPFYAESGGQIGDKGEIKTATGKAKVLDTVKKGDLIIHKVEVTQGKIRLDDEAQMKVFEDRRLDTARNHTATHLLHAALRKVIGEHVRQSGSLVEPERLRFDFTHFSALSRQEIKEVERIVNEKIRADIPVETQILSQEEAIAMGAMALFGEKYGDVVRVVSIPGFSIELCGGTHLDRTGQIGLFKIVSESSVASGIRRIEAVTGARAIDVVQEMEDQLVEIASSLKCPLKAIPKRIQALTERIKGLEKDLKKKTAGAATLDVERLVSDARKIDDIKVVSAKTDGMDAAMLRELGDKIRDRLKKGVVILGSSKNGKAMLLVMVTKNLTNVIRAGELVQNMSKEIKGGGGGRPDMAQAGGKDPSGLDKAIDKGLRQVEEALSS